MNEQYPCPFEDNRCLCKDCADNAAFEDCKHGYCINCFECEKAQKKVHDVYLCTGYSKREEGQK